MHYAQDRARRLKHPGILEWITRAENEKSACKHSKKLLTSSPALNRRRRSTVPQVGSARTRSRSSRPPHTCATNAGSEASSATHRETGGWPRIQAVHYV
eukprot:308455-Pleurochrysis_carterae.AAC.1